MGKANEFMFPSDFIQEKNGAHKKNGTTQMSEYFVFPYTIETKTNSKIHKNFRSCKQYIYIYAYTQGRENFFVLFSLDKKK